jgi:hypothetical protein
MIMILIINITVINQVKGESKDKDQDKKKGDKDDEDDEDKDDPSEEPSDDDCGGDSGDMQIFVTPLGWGKTITLHVEPTNTIAVVKTLLKNLLGIPKAEQRLIYNGEHLEDERTLSEYGIQNETVLSLVARALGGAPKKRQRRAEEEPIPQIIGKLHSDPLDPQAIQDNS